MVPLDPSVLLAVVNKFNLFIPVGIAPDVSRVPKIPLLAILKLFCFADIANLKLVFAGTVEEI